jgi:hypothetical protein
MTLLSQRCDVAMAANLYPQEHSGLVKNWNRGTRGFSEIGFYLFLFYVCECFVCMYSLFCGGQKKLLDSPELGSHRGESHHVGSEKQSCRSPGKAHSALNC